MMIETFIGKIWKGYVDPTNRSKKDKDIFKDHNFGPHRDAFSSESETTLGWAQGGLNPCPTGYEPVALPD